MGTLLVTSSLQGSQHSLWVCDAAVKGPPACSLRWNNWNSFLPFVAEVQWPQTFAVGAGLGQLLPGAGLGQSSPQSWLELCVILCQPVQDDKWYKSRSQVGRIGSCFLHGSREL